MTEGTSCRGHVVEQPLAIALRTGLLQILLEERKHAMEPAARRFTLRGTIQQKILLLRRKLLEWDAQIELVYLRGDLQHALQVCRTRPRTESPIKQRLRPIDDQLCRIEVVFAA